MSNRGRFYSRMDKPPGYYRSGLSFADIRRAMDGEGQMSLTQIIGCVAHLIPPEAAVRYFELHQGRGGSLETMTRQGLRDIVRRTVNRIAYDGRILKHGRGKDARFEWVATKEPAPKVDPAGRGHAVKGRAKRGRNKRVRRSDG